MLVQHVFQKLRRLNLLRVKIMICLLDKLDRGRIMKRKNKLILYSFLLILGLSLFVSEVFIFQKPDGIVGLMICIVSIYLILGSAVKLCKLSEKFTNALLNFLDLLFWLP